METKISKQFQKGLAEYDLTIDDLKGWYYCGSNRERNRFKINCPNDDMPDYTNECVCGHKIVENCYITDFKESFLIVGNCCKKRFLPKENAGKTCEICRKPHRNRKDNLCNHCRHNNGGICMICGTETMKKSFKKCVKCYYS